MAFLASCKAQFVVTEGEDSRKRVSRKQLHVRRFEKCRLSREKDIIDCNFSSSLLCYNCALHCNSRKEVQSTLSSICSTIDMLYH